MRYILPHGRMSNIKHYLQKYSTICLYWIKKSKVITININVLLQKRLTQLYPDAIFGILDKTLNKKQNFNTSKLACWVLRVTGIRILPIAFGMVCAVAPGVTLNIFSYKPGIWMLNFVKYNLLSEMFGSVLLEYAFVFFGNFIYWLLYVKIALVLTIELIICSTYFVKFINCFEGKAKKFRCDTTSLKLIYRQIKILVDVFNTIISAQLVVVLITFGSSQVSAALQILSLSVPKNPLLSFSQIATQIWISTFNIIGVCNLTIVILLLFGCCAEVHDTSFKVYADLKRRRSIKKFEHKLFLNSIPVLKIKFEGSNYLEKLTPVIFQT